MSSTDRPAASSGAVPKDLPLVILSGPSGVGKTTVIERLLAESDVKLVMSVSATTRPPRPGEADGVSYYFLDRNEFRRRLDAGAFLEWAEVHRSGHLYGTPLSELERAASLGGWALLEIDVEGAMNVLEICPHAVTIFLGAGPIEEYERRLRDRGTEDEETLRRRLETAKNELTFAPRYRHQVVNDDLDRCVAELCQILRDERDAL